jgi:iron complex outermembrane receptor protein
MTCQHGTSLAKRSNRRSSRCSPMLALPAGIALNAVVAQAQETAPAPGVELPPVTVEAARVEKIKGLIGTVPDTPSTAYAVTSEGLDYLSGGGGSTNPFRAIGLLPSVDAPAIDPYGLAITPGANKGIRIRGELSQHGGSNGTVDGIPLTGINPGPGYLWSIDNENLRGIELLQGPIPSDRSAYLTTAGVIDSLIRWPEPRAGGLLSQSVGTHGFLRSFARLDSGPILGGTTALFVSGSWTEASKWRGFGQAPDGQANVAMGIETHPIESLEARLLFSYSDLRANTYRALTYPQATTLGQYRFFDFVSAPFPPATTAVNYYGYNRQSFTDWTLLSEITYSFDASNRIVLKPYYFNEAGDYFDAMQNGKVRKWLIDHDNYGVVAEWQTRVAQADFKLGYWWGSLGLPGPPTAWKLYDPTSSGGLINASWSILAAPTSRHQFHSPYVFVDKDLGRLHMQFGARYIRETLPGINQLDATGIGDLSYDAAVAAASGVIANRSVTEWSTGAFLPYGAMSYDLTPDLQLRSSFGSNYAPPAFDVWPAFQQNAAAFLARGITADQLWHAIEPELSTGIDAGLRWSVADLGGLGSFSIEPLFYYVKFTNKAVSYDPGIGIAYSQNVAQSHAYGAQVIAHWLPVETFDIFASASYDRNVFDADLPTLPGASQAVRQAAIVTGGQLPNVPLWLASGGARWSLGNLAIMPVFHYVGSRFGDVAGTQPVPAYVVADLNFEFTHPTPWGNLLASLSITNIFDKSYIGFINNGYFQQSSATGAIYYPGAPRTIWGRVAFKF